MALNVNALTTLIVNDKQFTAAKDSAAAMSRLSTILNTELNKKTPTGGAAVGTVTVGPVVSPMTIPGSAFVNTLKGVTIALTPCVGGGVQLGTQVQLGVSVGLVNASAGPIIGSLAMGAAPGAAVLPIFPSNTGITMRTLAIKNHLTLPICSWLDAAIATLIIPVTGPSGGGVFAGTLTGLSFPQ